MSACPSRRPAYPIPFSRQVFVPHSCRAKYRTRSFGSPALSRRLTHVAVAKVSDRKTADRKMSHCPLSVSSCLFLFQNPTAGSEASLTAEHAESSGQSLNAFSAGSASSAVRFLLSARSRHPRLYPVQILESVRPRTPPWRLLSGFGRYFAVLSLWQ